MWNPGYPSPRRARIRPGRLARLALLLLTLPPALPAATAAEISLLNVSFDISRELYRQVNPAFARHWKTNAGGDVVIRLSNAGSSKQARAVLDGLEADVVTLNQATDIDVLAGRGRLLPPGWRTLLPHGSAPYSSTILFLVRKGNPKSLKDWDDLVRPGVAVIVPNPKTSGNGRYSYLAAWAFALERHAGDESKARAFVASLFRNATVLDTGGRGATTTFVERGIGDVLLTFEAEVLLTRRELGEDKFDVVLPSVSIEAEMPVAVVETVAQRRGTAKVARAYLEFLYTEEAQEIIARNFFRPRSDAVAARFAHQFPRLKLIRVEEAFGGWGRAQQAHFADGGVFDQITRALR